MTDPIAGAEESATTEVSIDAATASRAVADLQRQLDEAAPRLEAFAQLEAIADSQGTTPEAVAIKASIDVLLVDEADKRAELQDLEEGITRLQLANQQHVEERDMLIKQKDELREEIIIVLDEHTTIVDQMAEMIEELESIRADAVRLLGEKAMLETKVQALRDEVAALESGVPDLRGGRRHDDLAEAALIDDDEATAFDKFFEAEVVEDKARAWMLE